MLYQNIIIIGTGLIGTEVIWEIARSQGIAGNHQHPSRIVGIANINNCFVLNKDVIQDNEYSEEELIHFLKHESHPRTKDSSYDDLLAYVQQAGWKFSEIVFVDVTADKRQEIADFHKNVLMWWGKLVTANKNPLSLFDMNTFRILTWDRNRYKYSVSVMAGAPGIDVLQKSYDTRNTVLAIEWCFSGTLSYLTSELENGKKLSVILSDAIKNGYTEPNPWDDLNGLDVARKILILARTAGYTVNLSDITITSFLPDAYSKYTRDTIVAAVQSIDDEWSHRMQVLDSEWKTLRFIAKMNRETDGVHISVWLEEVLKNHPLGLLKWTMNKIAITTERAGIKIFEQAGAGISVTTQGILDDLASLLEERTM